MDINNSSKFEKGDRFLQNPINYFSDEILFQIGESYSKLVFYSYGKKINKDNLIEQDKDNKILNIEIQIPNHALKALSTLSLLLIEFKDTALKSLEDRITSPTVDAYDKILSKIQLQYFDTDPNTNFNNVIDDLIKLGFSLKTEIELADPNYNDKDNSESKSYGQHNY